MIADFGEHSDVRIDVRDARAAEAGQNAGRGASRMSRPEEEAVWTKMVEAQKNRHVYRFGETSDAIVKMATAEDELRLAVHKGQPESWFDELSQGFSARMAAELLSRTNAGELRASRERLAARIAGLDLQVSQIDAALEFIREAEENAIKNGAKGHG